MAEDYLTDDEQVEQIKRVVAENWLWILAGAVLGVGGWFGVTHYRNHSNEVALRAAGEFGAMTDALEGNDSAKSRRIAEGLVKDYPKTPYADQAQLTLARLDVDAGKPGDAIGPLVAVMTDSKDTELRHIARLRLARVMIDQGKPDEAITTLAADTPGSFAALFHEVRGDAYFAKQDFKNAVIEYKAALSGGEAAGAEAALVELKLADLGQSPTAAPAIAMTPASVPAADASNKAKP